MPRYDLTVEDAQGQPAVVTPEIVAAMDENLFQRGIGGSILQDENAVFLTTEEDLEGLVVQNKLRKIMANEIGYVPNMTTYLLDEIGEDRDGKVYNALFSVAAGGGRRRRRGKKTRKPKRKSRLTRRR